MALRIIVNGKCSLCGEEINGDNLFLCEKCKTKETILNRIEELEKFNNTDCPEWVKNVIRGI